MRTRHGHAELNSRLITETLRLLKTVWSHRSLDLGMMTSHSWEFWEFGIWEETVKGVTVNSRYIPVT
jgi:hypothetical protein